MNHEVGGAMIVPAHHKSTWVEEDIVVIMHGRPWQAVNEVLFARGNNLNSMSLSFNVSAKDLHAPTSSNAIGCRCVACRSLIPKDWQTTILLLQGVVFGCRR